MPTSKTTKVGEDVAATSLLLNKEVGVRMHKRVAEVCGIALI